VGRTEAEVAALLAAARRIVIVPGYGLARAQAQHALRAVGVELTSRGASVGYAVHPVAGRLPGHLNVLLDAAGVPFSALLDLARANAALVGADVALLVGANDIANPAARNRAGGPLAGLPILDVDRARSVVALKRGTGRGYADTENLLFEAPKTTLLLGDATDSLLGILAELGRRRRYRPS
jgi:NAD(P) transhydrogenase subunit beta